LALIQLGINDAPLPSVEDGDHPSGEHSDLPPTRTLEGLYVTRSSFYRWYQKYKEDGYEGLADCKFKPRQFWNRIPYIARDQVVQIALAHHEKSPRQLA
jgi:hypothetical protein